MGWVWGKRGCEASRFLSAFFGLVFPRMSFVPFCRVTALHRMASVRPLNSEDSDDFRHFGPRPALNRGPARPLPAWNDLANQTTVQHRITSSHSQLRHAAAGDTWVGGARRASAGREAVTRNRLRPDSSIFPVPILTPCRAPLPLSLCCCCLQLLLPWATHRVSAIHGVDTREGE